MKINVWDNEGKTADRYTIQIGNDFYTMSFDCHMPNGVFMYIGEYGDVHPMKNYDNKSSSIDNLPSTVLRKILHIINNN